MVHIPIIERRGRFSTLIPEVRTTGVGDFLGVTKGRAAPRRGGRPPSGTSGPIPPGDKPENFPDTDDFRDVAEFLGRADITDRAAFEQELASSLLRGATNPNQAKAVRFGTGFVPGFDILSTLLGFVGKAFPPNFSDPVARETFGLAQQTKGGATTADLLASASVNPVTLQQGSTPSFDAFDEVSPDIDFSTDTGFGATPSL